MRNYAQTVDYLFSLLPMYQNVGKQAFKKDLTNTLDLLKACGNPHHNQKYIHITGSNGKGSVSSFMASILQEQGLKVGLYTSPHLVDYTERIRINEQCIEKQFVVNWVAGMQKAIEEIKPSFFELTVALALDYFAQQQCDIAVIEVGLGGRLDSTNVINPLMAIITNIALEHTDMLGNTLAEIATEKAGIIKPNIPVIIGETTLETLPVFELKCKQENAKLVIANKAAPQNWFDLSGLKANYQYKNLATIYAAIGHLPIKIKNEAIELGLKHVVKNAGIMGRWQQIGYNPSIFLDTAHNAHGLSNLVAQIEKESYNNLHLVFGVVKDKDLSSIATILPKNATYYCCKPQVIRGKVSTDLHADLTNLGFTAIDAGLPKNAFKMAKKAADKNDLIVVTGSNFVVGDVLASTKYGL